MRFLSAAFAATLLAACSSLPYPQTVPNLARPGQWYKLEQTDASGHVLQTSLLAVEQLEHGIRFVQTDALGAPVSRQIVGADGWKNDGFVMPNPASRRLFASLLPLLAADRSATLYPNVAQKPSGADSLSAGFCPDGNGALFSYRERNLWCVAHQDGRFVIGFPDKVFWTVSPVDEE